MSILILNIILCLLFKSVNCTYTTSLLNQLHTPRKFNILLNFGLKHFNKAYRTYILTNDYEYSNDIAREMNHHFDSIIIGNESKKIILNMKYRSQNYNVLLFNFTYNDMYYLHSGDNVLIYVDLRDKKLNLCEYFIRKHLLKASYKLAMVFRTLFLFEFPKSFRSEYEFWVREIWGGNRRIFNLSKAYFNLKPNFHQDVIGITSNLKLNQLDDLGKIKEIKKFIFKNWNASSKPSYPDINIKIMNVGLGMMKRYDIFQVVPMCVVIQKGNEIPSWQALTRSYPLQVWIVIIITWFLSSLFWTCVLGTVSLFESLSKMMSIYSTQPIHWMASIERMSERILVGTMMLLSIVIITGFQSSLYSHLQSPGYYPPINSLRELNESNLTIHCTYTYSCLSIFNYNNQTDPLIKDIGKKSILSEGKFKTNYHSNISLNTLYENSSIALILPCDIAKKSLEQISKYSIKLHLINEIIIIMPIYFGGGARGCPFFSQLKIILLLFQQNGIAQWLDYIEEWKSLMKQSIFEKEPEKLKVFSIVDLQIAFLILIIGEVLAIFLFLIEIFFPVLKHFYN